MILMLGLLRASVSIVTSDQLQWTPLAVLFYHSTETQAISKTDSAPTDDLALHHDRILVGHVAVHESGCGPSRRFRHLAHFLVVGSFD